MAAVLAAIGVKPDCAATTPGARLVFAHRVVDSADVYFVANQKPSPDTVECAFRTAGRLPELWDAESGKMQPAPFWRVEDGRTRVTLDLEQAGSVFVVFRTPAAPPADPLVTLAAPPAPPSAARMPNLEIHSARYGSFSLGKSGMVDVTDLLVERVKDGRLSVKASNDLAGDPAVNIVKKLRVEYECGGHSNQVTVAENKLLELPAAGETGAVQVIRAVYGNIKDDLNSLPAIKAVDVTERVRSRIQDRMLTVRADNNLAGSDPANLVSKELRVEYALDGVTHHITVEENAELSLPEDAWLYLPPRPRVLGVAGNLVLAAAEPGTYTFTTAAGRQKSVEIAPMPKPIEIKGPWTVVFPKNLGAPEKAVFDQLVSWPDHSDARIKYFSGTAAYWQLLTIPAENLATNRILELDLGRVQVIAEVRLNGKYVATLWKAPFRAEVTHAVKPGENELEIRVTNLWPNRLIGDEQYPADCEWDGIAIKRWPDWMVKGEPRPVSERVTFTTWKHWSKDSPLQPSGLLGPVVLRTLTQMPVK